MPFFVAFERVMGIMITRYGEVNRSVDHIYDCSPVGLMSI